MNLATNPSIEDLIILVSQFHDDESDHIIWVDKDGDVHITPLSEDLTPAGWTTQNSELIKFRLETLMEGNGYVGIDASQDDSWINRLYKALITNWEKDSQGYIDNF